MSYTEIENILSQTDNYNRIIRCIRNGVVFALRINIPSITKCKHLNAIRKLLGESVNVWYDSNQEFVEIKIPL